MNKYTAAVVENIALIALAAFVVWFTGSAWGLVTLLFLNIFPLKSKGQWND